MSAQLSISQPRQSSLHIDGRTSGAATAPARATGQRATKGTQFQHRNLTRMLQLLSLCLALSLSDCLSVCLSLARSLARSLFCLPVSVSSSLCPASSHMGPEHPPKAVPSATLLNLALAQPKFVVSPQRTSEWLWLPRSTTSESGDVGEPQSDEAV